MIHLDAAKHQLPEIRLECGVVTVKFIASENGRVQTYTANNRWTEKSLGFVVQSLKRCSLNR